MKDLCTAAYKYIKADYKFSLYDLDPPEIIFGLLDQTCVGGMDTSGCH